jgi:hypothetical protein
MGNGLTLIERRRGVRGDDFGAKIWTEEINKVRREGMWHGRKRGG